MTSIKKTLLLTTALILFWDALATAQEMFQTKEGNIEIIGSYNNNKIKANSKFLYAVINYNTAEIELTLNPTTLLTTIDSFNTQLAKSVIEPVTLKGHLNIPFVNTLSHPDYEINFEADLNLNGVEKKIFVTGQLQHIASYGVITCQLTLKFKLSPTDYNIDLPKGWNNEINVQIFQAVLNNEHQ
jgi:hypothetical protein